MPDRRHDEVEPAPEPARADVGRGEQLAVPEPVLAAGNVAMARYVVARVPADGAAAPAAPPAAPAGLIADDAAGGGGQMKPAEFRAALSAAANAALEQTLGATPWVLIPARAALADRLGPLAALDAKALEQEVRRAVPSGAGATTAQALAQAAAVEVARAAASYGAEAKETTGPADQGANPLESAVSMVGALFKRRGPGAASAEPGRLARLGRGKPLDSRLGTAMGSAFGSDFSDVRLHAGPEAGAMSDSLGARAFTVGRDIAFGSGEYKPGTVVGDALIAHELAHVVQQRGAPAAGPLAKGPGGVDALEEDADRSAVGAVVALWSGLGDRSAAFAAAAMPRLRTGLQLQRCSKPAPLSNVPEIEATPEAAGKRIVEGMSNANKAGGADAGIHYAHNYKKDFPDKFKEDYWNGYADDGFFERKGKMHWQLKSGASASAAIKKWLKGLTIAECLSTVVAVQTDALRAAIGDAKFDEHFGSTNGPGTEGLLVIKEGWDGSSIGKYVKETEPSAKGEAGTPGKRPAKVGERYYFTNHPCYLLKHPGGAWQGENSLFEGEQGGVQYWSGLGAGHKTEDDLLAAMRLAYDADRTSRDIEVLNQRHGSPDKWPHEYKEAKDGGDQFPNKLNSIKDILDAPEREVRGKVRKGGFKPSSGIELDMTKVKAL